ncbi:MAG: hypothetical protein K6G61_02240, partial [Solobacterium sp.]|nr:hypothetical protein [Solobacterium sp.]
MYKKLYAVLMSLFLMTTVLPQSIYAEEEPVEAAGEITETEETGQEEDNDPEEPAEISGPSAEEEEQFVDSKQSNDDLLQQ